MEYCRPLSKEWLLEVLLQSEQYQIKRYVRALRSEEYYTSVKPCNLLKYWYFGKKNRIGGRLGFFIPAGCFGPDLKIWHYGSVIVNPNARIGSGCQIHGNCCIGNRLDDQADVPTIGNGVNIGQGAQILGRVKIADGVTIGAGAIVLKDIDEPGASAVGVPAKTVGR